MLEAMIIISIISVISLFPLRGKSLDQLNQKQLQKIDSHLNRYNNSKKGRVNPKTREEILLMLQKQAITFLILLLALIPLYILILVLVYPALLA